MGNEYSAIPEKSEEKKYTEEQINLINKFNASPFITLHDNALVIFIPFPNLRLRIKSFEIEPNKEFEVLAIAIDYVENKLIPKLREQLTPQEE